MTTLPFTRTIDLDPVPAGKHLVGFADEQRAAREEKVISTLPPPQPKPEPEIVRRRREQAAALAQQAEQATAAATAADAEATVLKNEIHFAEESLRAIEIKLAKLEAQNFLKQGEQARASLKAGIHDADIADPTNGVQRAAVVMLRAAEFEKLRLEALKETQSELASAKRHLADLTGAR